MPIATSIPLLRAALAGLLLAAAGCSRIGVAVRSATPLNPNEHGESTPVDIRCWQLSRPERFRAATVDQLWTADGPTLATDRCGDAVTATVVPSQPGSSASRVELGRRAAGAEWIGVLALFPAGDARDARTAVVRIDQLDERELLLSGRSVAVVELTTRQPAATGAASTARPSGGKAAR